MIEIFRRWSRVTLLVLFTWIAACANAPPLSIKSEKGGVVVDVQTLGEYRTSVSRVRLTDTGTGEVLWELTARDGEPQIHEIALRPGANSAEIPSVSAGTFKVVVPSGSNSFALPSGGKFLIEVWNPSGAHSSASFAF